MHKLEQYYSGDENFIQYSNVFSDEWDRYTFKDELLTMVNNDVDLARPISYYAGDSFEEFMINKIPVLDDISPKECLGNQSGIRRLKTCLMRMQ